MKIREFDWSVRGFLFFSLLLFGYFSGHGGNHSSTRIIPAGWNLQGFIFFSDISKMLFSPFPNDWGFLDKPVELLFFKALYSIFGLQPVYYYTTKCILFAITSILIYLLTSIIFKDIFPSNCNRNYAAFIAVLLFVKFEPIFLSIVWLSDFEILSQLTITSALIIYLYYLEKLNSNRPFTVFDKILLQLLIFFISFIGFKTKFTAKIIPIIIGFHIVLRGKRTLIHFCPLILALITVNVPWSTLSNHPLPPILDFSTKQVLEAYYWQPANITSFTDLLVGGEVRIWPFHIFKYSPYGLIQVLFPFGIMNISMVIILLYLYRERQGPSGISHSLWKSNFQVIIIWVALNIVLLSGYPKISNDLRSRHLFFILVPICVMIGSINSYVLYKKNINVVAKIAITLLLVLQLIVGIYQTDIRKRTSGYFMIMGNKARQIMENDYKNSNIIFIGFPDTGYMETGSGNKYYLAHNIHIIIPDDKQASSPNWTFESEIRLDTGWYYDLIGSSIPRYNLYIYKYKY